MNITEAPRDTHAHCLHLPEITQTGVGTPELVISGIETHSPHPRPWTYVGNGFTVTS